MPSLETTHSLKYKPKLQKADRVVMSVSATTMGCLNLIEKEPTKISSLVVIPFVTSVTLKLGHGQQLWRKYEAEGLLNTALLRQLTL